MLPRALNHMAVPALRWDAFLTLAQSLGCVGVEFRNDLPTALFDGDDPAHVKAAAEAAGVRILALAEVKAFNDWSDAKAAEAEALMQIAVACGAEAISLIARNDGLACGAVERRENLRRALAGLQPMLARYGLVGLIEPLGFDICALRYKSEAVAVIEDLNATDQFKLVHDTFHHILAGELDVFAAHTGLVHISGVTDPTVTLADLTDGHRGLVDAEDRLGNIDQIHQLRRAGYRGPISFEPFAPEVHSIADPGPALAGSFDFISTHLAELAA